MVQRIFPFEPINQTTPFTYRDNETYLTQLRGLRAKINELISYVHESDADLAEQFNLAILSLDTAFNATLDAMRAEFIGLIEAASDREGVVSYDPTNGRVTNPISRVISNVYDNTRIYAYFAIEYDALELTAKQYDDLQTKARRFDLAMTYPNMHDTRTDI